MPRSEPPSRAALLCPGPPSRFALRRPVRSLTIRVSRRDVKRDRAIGQETPEAGVAVHAQHDAHPPDLQHIDVKPIDVAIIGNHGPS